VAGFVCISAWLSWRRRCYAIRYINKLDFVSHSKWFLHLCKALFGCTEMNYGIELSENSKFGVERI
jgi:hypothetical protein